jgi:hypothetical protein
MKRHALAKGNHTLHSSATALLGCRRLPLRYQQDLENGIKFNEKMLQRRRMELASGATDPQEVQHEIYMIRATLRLLRGCRYAPDPRVSEPSSSAGAAGRIATFNMQWK